MTASIAAANMIHESSVYSLAAYSVKNIRRVANAAIHNVISPCPSAITRPDT